jgi:hypothetical protein
LSIPDFGGRTRGIPWQVSFGHSSPSIAHPFNSFFPISEDALSDCSRRRRVSAVSGGGANVGELWASDISVGGVDVREVYDSDEEIDREVEAGLMFCGWVSRENIYKLSIPGVV